MHDLLSALQINHFLRDLLWFGNDCYKCLAFPLVNVTLSNQMNDMMDSFETISHLKQEKEPLLIKRTQEMKNATERWLKVRNGEMVNICCEMSNARKANKMMR